VETMKCPNCLSESVSMTGDVLYCRTCNLTVDMKTSKFCERVPVFNPVPETLLHTVGQLYKDGFGHHWQLMGTAPGCGRVVLGDYCTSCRPFLPEVTDRPTRKGKAVARVSDAE
jgi:hypothetical protein